MSIDKNTSFSLASRETCSASRSRTMLAVALMLLFFSAIFLCACAPEIGDGTGTVDGVDIDPKWDGVDDSDTTLVYSERDLSGEYDDYVYEMSLESPVGTNGVVVGSTDTGVPSITFTKSGTYVLSGDYNGSLIVDADKERDKIQLVLEDVNIRTKGYPCILVVGADKVFVTVKGDVSLEDAADGIEDFKALDERTGYDSTIYSKDDITFNGKGKLSIIANYERALRGTDVVFAGDIDMTMRATDDGMKAKNSVKIACTKFLIEAENDGITCENVEKENKGVVLIDSTDATIVSGNDGIQASNMVVINGRASIFAKDKFVKTNGMFNVSRQAVFVGSGNSRYSGVDARSEYLDLSVVGSKNTSVSIIDDKNKETIDKFEIPIEFERIVYVNARMLEPNTDYTVRVGDKDEVVSAITHK